MDTPFKIGEKYLIRTVTMTLIGELTFVGSQELALKNASWIADTGRFHDALKEGIETLSPSEIEPFIDDVIVGRGAIVDATVYRRSLALSQK